MKNLINFILAKKQSNTINKTEKIQKNIYIRIFFTVLFLILIIPELPAQGSQSREQSSSEEITHEGLPHYRRDAGSRGICVADEKDFIALVPNQPINKAALISSQLSFFKPLTNSPKTLEFIVRDREDNIVHEAFINVTEKAGIMSLEIPKKIADITIATPENYHWYLSLICDPKKRSKDLVLKGWIEYVKLDKSLEEKIMLSDLPEKFSLLKQEGIWYDALSVIVEQKRIGANSTFTNSQWSKLLESIDLLELESEDFTHIEKTQ